MKIITKQEQDNCQQFSTHRLSQDHSQRRTIDVQYIKTRARSNFPRNIWESLNTRTQTNIRVFKIDFKT